MFSNSIKREFECKEYHQEILIEEECANEFFDLNMITIENKNIRKQIVTSNTTILSNSKCLCDVLWAAETDYTQS
jgi:hypothetical protein